MRKEESKRQEKRQEEHHEEKLKKGKLYKEVSKKIEHNRKGR